MSARRGLASAAVITRAHSTSVLMCHNGVCVGVCVFRDCYTEKCVMNNYFGIGLDAKISLDFNNKRDEHPEKCR